MADLYPITTSGDIGELFNNTLSNVCMDITDPSTCGAFIFFDIFLLVGWLLLFSYFRVNSSFKDAYAGSSTIMAFLSIILFLSPYNLVRDIELLFIVANMFLSIIALYMIKD